MLGSNVFIRALLDTPFPEQSSLLRMSSEFGSMPTFEFTLFFTFEHVLLIKVIMQLCINANVNILSIRQHFNILTKGVNSYVQINARFIHSCTPGICPCRLRGIIAQCACVANKMFKQWILPQKTLNSPITHSGEFLGQDFPVCHPGVKIYYPTFYTFLIVSIKFVEISTLISNKLPVCQIHINLQVRYLQLPYSRIPRDYSPFQKLWSKNC